MEQVQWDTVLERAGEWVLAVAVWVMVEEAVDVVWVGEDFGDIILHQI